MNPTTNKFEHLISEAYAEESLRAIQERGEKIVNSLLRPNGEPVPEHWSVFIEGELVTIKNSTFKVAHIGESHMLLEPAGPLLLGEDKEK